MSELAGYALQAAVTLVLLAAAVVALAWGLRRWSFPRRAGGRINVLEQLPLGVGVRLVIVEIDGRRLLLGVTPQRVSVLCELPQTDPESVDA